MDMIKDKLKKMNDLLESLRASEPKFTILPDNTKTPSSSRLIVTCQHSCPSDLEMRETLASIFRRAAERVEQNLAAAFLATFKEALEKEINTYWNEQVEALHNGLDFIEGRGTEKS